MSLWVIEYQWIGHESAPWATSSVHAPQHSLSEGTEYLRKAENIGCKDVRFRLVKYVREGA